MKYLQQKGYKIVPVNPGAAGTKILGEEVYASLKDIPFPVDMVDVFRPPKFAPGLAEDAVAIGAKVLWLQLGVISEEARVIAESAGLEVNDEKSSPCCNAPNVTPSLSIMVLCRRSSWTGVRKLSFLDCLASSDGMASTPTSSARIV